MQPDLNQIFCDREISPEDKKINPTKENADTKDTHHRMTDINERRENSKGTGRDKDELQEEGNE